MTEHADLWKGTIEELLALPEPEFNFMLERIRRAHLEGKGYRYLDEEHPAGCPTCEG
jgi:hypothetical protein